jgi:hypothetical protein
MNNNCSTPVRVMLCMRLQKFQIENHQSTTCRLVHTTEFHPEISLVSLFHLWDSGWYFLFGIYTHCCECVVNSRDLCPGPSLNAAMYGAAFLQNCSQSKICLPNFMMQNTYRKQHCIHRIPSVRNNESQSPSACPKHQIEMEMHCSMWCKTP